MILIIIFSIILVLGIAGVIIYNTKWSWEFEREWVVWVSTISAVVSGLPLFVMGIIAIVVNSPAYCHKISVKYEQEVVELQATYNSIANINEEYARYTAIQQYNTQVKEFKETIIHEQYCLNNPWINWLSCNAYKNMDANIVSYIEK